MRSLILTQLPRYTVSFFAYDSDLLTYCAAVLHAALRVLPVRPSVTYALVIRKQRNAKMKLAQTFPTARVSELPIFSSKGQRSRSQDVKTFKISRHLYVREAAQADQARQAIVRPTLLSAPETLGSGTDGRIQCRRGHLLLN